MLSLARSFPISSSYPIAGNHSAAIAGPWVCAEAADRRRETKSGLEAMRSDALAVSLRAAVERLSVPLARAAAVFVQQEGWTALGFARLEDCARERYGRSGRWVRDLASLGRSLESLPRLADALTGRDGGAPLGRVAARIVGEVASEESIEWWIGLARRTCVRELMTAVRRHAAAEAIDVPESDAGMVLLRLALPSPVRAAFDEAADLYRCVEGHEATLASFVEALVAEAMTGPDSPPSDPDIHAELLKHVELRARTELALAHSTGKWRHLEAALKRFDLLQSSAGSGDAAALDRQIRDLVALEDELELHIGSLLVEMGDAEAWSRLRFAGAGHYAEERLGLCRTAARDRARAARLLRRLPIVRVAYESGRIGMQAALLIGRILLRSGAAEIDEATQRLWVQRAAEATIKRMRDEAKELARRGAEQERPLDDVEWHASLRREPGMARARVSRYAAHAAATPLSDVFLTLRLPAGVAGDLMAAIHAARKGLSAHVATIDWETPCVDSFSGPLRVARECYERGRRAPAWIGLLAMLQDFVETWDQGVRRKGDAIYERDGYRCMAPGCTSRRNLESHHVLYRSRGGGDAQENRICLCRFHHQRGEHGGLASCRGEAPLGITWALGRRGAGGRFRNELRISSGAPGRATSGAGR